MVFGLTMCWIQNGKLVALCKLNERIPFPFSFPLSHLELEWITICWSARYSCFQRSHTRPFATGQLALSRLYREDHRRLRPYQCRTVPAGDVLNIIPTLFEGNLLNNQEWKQHALDQLCSDQRFHLLMMARHLLVALSARLLGSVSIVTFIPIRYVL